MLGFATVGFGILYLAFRYRVLFTLGTQVDTKGRAYAKALQQLTVGIYLAEICMIGLFAIGTSGNSAAVGPLVLMIIFTIGTVIWHWQLRSAMSKHTTTLPNDLLAEECRSPSHREADQEKGLSDQESEDVAKKDDTSSGDSTYQTPRSESPPKPPKGIVGKIKAFLFPSKFASAAVISKHILSPHLSQAVRPYCDKEREEAYMHPAFLAETPAIWLARDRFGLSQQEVAANRELLGREVIITDEGASFDDKGKLHWDEQDARKAPLWKDNVDY